MLSSPQLSTPIDVPTPPTPTYCLIVTYLPQSVLTFLQCVSNWSPHNWQELLHIGTR